MDLLLYSKQMNKIIRLLFFIILIFVDTLLFIRCRQEIPVMASIVIDAESLKQPVNPIFYGVSLEELDHAVEGGIYAELIQNRSFEDGIAPLNCPFDRNRKLLITPNGFTIPFCGEDSIVGWHKLSVNTHVAPDRTELINDKNKRSLLVGVYNTGTNGRGGVVAEGYKGIAVRKGEKYNLSLYLKSAYTLPGKINIAIETADTKRTLTDVYGVNPLTEWQYLQYTFTATDSVDNAVLTITADSTAMFWIDVVSLFPEKTWKGRKNGFRADLMESIANLNPGFVRFPGGVFVEGYTAGTYPEWKETIGNISERKHFWSIAGYGTTNGAGFHEYLQLCEDLKAEPVYVVNCGITNQYSRPRYEEMKTMDVFVQNALDAIEYANAPADSVWGAARVENGHAAPFGLKYIEIGNENFGAEYHRRYELFKNAIQEKYPDVTVLATDSLPKNRWNWIDRHFYAGEMFLMAHHNHYNPDKYSRKLPPVCVGAFSAVDNPEVATLHKAVAEACFMIGLERNPDIVKLSAYAPLLANTDYVNGQIAAINFNNNQLLKTPSYHLLQLFASNRGDEVLKTEVTSFHKPQVTFGAAGVYLFDNAYELADVKLDSLQYHVVPEPNKWNYIVFGDSAAHDYVLSARIRRTKGSGHIQINLRDNRKLNDKQNHIAFTLGTDESTLSYNVGKASELLSSHPQQPFINDTWYDVKVICKDELVKCYVNDLLIHEVSMRPIPSLVSVALLDKKNNQLILKVVNTTYREEKTHIDINGLSVSKEVEVTEISGDPNSYNTYTSSSIIPVKKTVFLSGISPLIYSFPPNSITVMRLNVN